LRFALNGRRLQAKLSANKAFRKQNTFQLGRRLSQMLVRFGRFGYPLCRAIPGFSLFCLFILAFSSIAVAQTTTNAAPVKAARMRLIAAAGVAQGIYHAAAVIETAPLAITYWRQPGEAGVPPRFSFEGSENLASAEVLYPSPSRLEEGGSEAFGYRGGTAFPIHVTPRDANLPTRLKLTADFAVCEAICIPVRATADLVLPRSGMDEGANALVEAADARVPAILGPRDFAAKAMIAPKKGAVKPTWTLSWKDAAGLVDVFVEAPEGYYFETQKANEHEFALVAVEMPSNAPAKPVDVRLTAVGAEKNQQSYEFTATLTPADAKDVTAH
jgi:DsbC/DsbD-like thiol-disulfide interchange protein